MRIPRRPRGLSGEDAYLWGEIARLITPLRGRALARTQAPAPATEASAAPKAGPATPPVPTLKPAPPRPMPKTLAKQILAKQMSAKQTAATNAPSERATAKPALPPVAPAPAPGLERRVRLGLRRGSLQVDARIDLHGLYQAEAHGALHGFLMRARAAGHTHVLVVTGKGGPSYDDAFSERGVLRRSVPHWLRAPDLRHVVLGFEEAARHHGGAGALYVRLRRR